MITILSGTGFHHEISIVRNVDTPIGAFKSAVIRIGLHLAAEATKHLPFSNGIVATPLAPAPTVEIKGSVVLVPVLRAGLGLLEPFSSFLPDAKVGFVGLKRNEETLEPMEYYKNLPPSDSDTTFIVIDPMLATGGSAAATLDILKLLPHHSIMYCSMIAAPEGIKKLSQLHPDVAIILGILDDRLNQDGYIVPGLGDAGDRLFGTL